MRRAGSISATPNLLGLNRPADAIAPLQRAVALKPGWADAQYFLGKADTQLDRYADAIAPLSQAVQLDPNYQHGRAWYLLGMSYNNTHQFEKQFAMLQYAERTAGGSLDYAGWYDFGQQYRGLHACPQGIHAYQQAVRLKPDFGDGWNNLGNCDEEMGQLGTAKGAFQRAAQLGIAQAAANVERVNGEIAVANAKASSPSPDTGGYFDPAQQRLHERNCDAYGHDDQSARQSLGC